MKIRYYIDPETRYPHIYKHNISEFEVETVLKKPGEDRPGKEGSRIAIGKTENGRYISGNILKAYRRRRRRKQL